MTDATSGQRLHTQIVSSLGRAIVTGEMPEGTPLMTSELERDLQVSRSVLREVFRVLESKGLINARPRVGTLVSGADSWDYLDTQIIHWRLTGPDREAQIAELNAVRLAVEPAAARLIALRGNNATIETLNKRVEEMYAAWRDRDLYKFTKADVQFHTSIVELSGSRMFLRLKDVVEAAVRLREVLTLPFEDSNLVGLERHRSLLDALRLGDVRAEQIAREMVCLASEEYELER